MPDSSAPDFTMTAQAALDIWLDSVKQRGVTLSIDKEESSASTIVNINDVQINSGFLIFLPSASKQEISVLGADNRNFWDDGWQLGCTFSAADPARIESWTVLRGENSRQGDTFTAVMDGFLAKLTPTPTIPKDGHGTPPDHPNP